MNPSPELIKRAKSGDKDALTRLIIDSTPLLKRVVAPFNIIGTDKEDLLQEATLALIKAVDKYDEHAGQSFSTFLYAVARQRIIDVLKHANNSKHAPISQTISIDAPSDDDRRLDPEDDSKDVIESYIDKERDDLFHRVADEILGKREKQVLELYLAGKSYKEMATELSVSVKTVDNTLSNVKKKLREKKELFD